MKDLFYNSKGFNTAKITINSFKKEIELYYHLNDNPVQHIWQEIHLNSKKFKMGISSSTDTNELVKELKNLCNQVNEPLEDFQLTQIFLNNLHSKFVFSQSSTNTNLQNKWLKINHIIHALESKIDNPLSKYK